MKWLRRIFIALVALVLGLVGFVVSTALGSEQPVGFQLVRATGADGRPFAVGVWYPTDANPRPTTFLGGQMMDVAPEAAVSGKNHPLVVISHGNGGGPGSHADLALFLANAGYVVAAPMHTGDNYADQSAAGSVNLFSGRNRELQATVDFMLNGWRGRDSIDRQRIGAFGLSAGAFTVLTAVGAQPDLSMIPKHCAASPEFVCDVLRVAKSPLVRTDTKTWGDAFLPDARIKAAVVAAPGLGFTLAAPHGLANVGVPIQLWSGDMDDKVPYATNAKLVRESLGDKVEFHSVPGAGHTSFLVPCGLLAPPAICSDPGEFDRKSFHASMNADVLAFFERNMNKL
jgi:predicted dienelactone hydrolase